MYSAKSMRGLVHDAKSKISGVRFSSARRAPRGKSSSLRNFVPSALP
jgi:hypothetical protein